MRKIFCELIAFEHTNHPFEDFEQVLRQVKKMNLYALHGFLGLPEDWIVNFPLSIHFKTIDLYQESLAIPEKGLKAWAESFNRLAAIEPKPKFLLGYSLGGRLAMHALIDRPDLWSGGVIISAHPGGLTSTEQTERIKSDERWAKRFIDDPWDQLMVSWNSQKVLSTSNALERKEGQYKRQVLSSTLKGWSLGLQEDLRSQLSALQLPLLWLTGERDSTLTQQSAMLKFWHPRSRKKIVMNAGHRVPWDNPKEFYSHLNEFILEC